MTLVIAIVPQLMHKYYNLCVQVLDEVPDIGWHLQTDVCMLQNMLVGHVRCGMTDERKQ